MIATNKVTGEDITGLVIQLLKGEITRKQFEAVTKLTKYVIE